MIFVFLIISLIFIAFMLVYFNRYRKEKVFWAHGLTTKDMSADNRIIHYFATISTGKLLIYACILAVLIKVGCSFIPTNHGDLEIFRVWSIQLASGSPANYYESALPPRDYTAGYLYVLWFLGGIRWLLQLNTTGMLFTIILKMPAIICEIATGYVLFKIARRYMSERLSILLSLIYVINPFVVINSSVWGQMDGVSTLFMFLTIYAMLNKQMISVCVYFTIGLLIKFQTVFVAPVVLIYIIIRMIKNVRNERVIFPITIACCLIGFYLVFLPFTIHQVQNGHPFYLLEVYINQLRNYNEYTLNAFNIFALLGYNRVGLTIPVWTNILISVLIVLFFSAAAIMIYLKKRDRGCLFLCSAFLILSVFMFSFKIHERYLYPAMLMLLTAAVIYNSKYIYGIYIGFSISQFFNLALILISQNQGFPTGESAYMFIGGLANVLLYAYFIYVGMEVVFKNKVVPIDYTRRVDLNGMVNIDECRIKIGGKGGNRDSEQ